LAALAFTAACFPPEKDLAVEVLETDLDFLT
jgi:hypothetical protein